MVKPVQEKVLVPGIIPINYEENMNNAEHNNHTNDNSSNVNCDGNSRNVHNKTATRWMEEILQHLGPPKHWNFRHIEHVRWCKISFIHPQWEC